MHPITAAARRAGALYFAFMIVAIVSEFLFPAFLAPGDAAATARSIAAAESTYRLSILAGFVTLIIFIFLAVSLYNLFRDVDRGQAQLMVLFVTVGVAVALANLLSQFVPLVLLRDAEALSAFTKPQLDALALGALRLHSTCAAVSTAFWGLWLFPFGRLVTKSGFFPRVLGVLLLVAGIGYLVSSVTHIILPEQPRLVSRLLMPLYFGEIPIIFWLLIKGAKAPSGV